MINYFNHLMNWLENMGQREWFAVLAVVILVGYFSLRGFGSRSNY
jgi:hypothetical protein